MATLAERARAADPLLDRYRRSWIDGRDWTEADGAVASVNPANGASLGETETVGAAGVDAAVASARRAFATWGRLPLAERSRMLRIFADAVAAHAHDLAQLEALEVGRPLGDAAMVIGMAPDMLRRYAGMAERAQGDLVAAEQHQLGVSWRRPRGVVGAIVPWNFPVMNVMMRLAPALAAGNAIVVKPSEYAPRTAVALAQIASEAGLPNGVFNVVLGVGQVAGHALAAHRDVDLITFTGSTATGLAISRAAASETLKPVMMECGGKSPQIVLEDAFEDPAIWHPIFFSGFWNTGQWCAAKTRLLVPKPRVDAAIKGLRTAAAGWRVGDPMEADTRLGPLINAAQRDRVEAFYEEARRAGSIVSLDCPQAELHPEGCFATPSLALGQPRGGTLVREEVFGPLITVEPFEDVDDAIALANDTDYGLMASIWTNRADLGHRLAREVVAGAITIHTSAEAAIRAAPDFVGASLEPQKQSGHGIDGGVAGLLAYTTAQSITFLS
jgi:acyl-CoA reductase-like NAD-dependent aldehyde dehydrogenase